MITMHRSYAQNLYLVKANWLPQVVQEYERAVIFRLGRLLPGGAKGPGQLEVVRG